MVPEVLALAGVPDKAVGRIRVVAPQPFTGIVPESWKLQVAVPQTPVV